MLLNRTRNIFKYRSCAFGTSVTNSNTNTTTVNNKFKETYGIFIKGEEIIPDGSTKFPVIAPFNGEKLCDVVSTDVKLARKVCSFPFH